MHASGSQGAEDELTNLMTILYMLIQHALVFPEELDELPSRLSPSPPPFATPITHVLTLR